MLRARTCLEMVRYMERREGGERKRRVGELAGVALEERGDENTQREGGRTERGKEEK